MTGSDRVTVDGREIRFRDIVDEFTREALATTAARSFAADGTTILLDTVIVGQPPRYEPLGGAADRLESGIVLICRWAYRLASCQCVFRFRHSPGPGARG